MLNVENISFAFEPRKEPDHLILKNITFRLQKAETIGIVGESGAGKTTLAKILAGLLAPSSGKITNPAGRNPVQILFQNTGDIINPFRQVREIVFESALINKGDKASAESYSEYLMDILHIQPEYRDKKGYELSGGVRQRAALARILASGPDILILDEPFAAQDAGSQNNLLDVLKEIKRQFKLSIICISHTIKLLKEFADRIIVLKEGEIVEEGNNPEIFNNPSHWYTKLLFKAEAYSLDKNDEALLRNKKNV